MTGVEIIATERKRQIENEGFSAQRDSQYVNNELPDEAICYLVDPDLRDAQAFPWPWDKAWWKPSPENRIRELAKAGALIAAEIDRLQQSQSNPKILNPGTIA